MSQVQSRITAQGQVSIPVSVMRRFGLAPGVVISWSERDGHLVIQKAGPYTLEDVQKALKLPRSAPHSAEAIRAGIRARIRAKHASR